MIALRVSSSKTSPTAGRIPWKKKRKNQSGIRVETLCLKSPHEKISNCKFSVYYYETVAQTSHKNINQGIFENILKNTEKIH
jgi:hypothetical protein